MQEVVCLYTLNGIGSRTFWLQRLSYHYHALMQANIAYTVLNRYIGFFKIASFIVYCPSETLESP
jgi:hypothetical protein